MITEGWVLNRLEEPLENKNVSIHIFRLSERDKPTPAEKGSVTVSFNSKVRVTWNFCSLLGTKAALANWRYLWHHYASLFISNKYVTWRDTRFSALISIVTHQIFVKAKNVWNRSYEEKRKNIFHIQSTLTTFSAVFLLIKQELLCCEYIYD
jgi:hypothetical protein